MAALGTYGKGERLESRVGRGSLQGRTRAQVFLLFVILIPEITHVYFATGGVDW